MSTIESADQTTEIAVTFLERYHPLLQRPLRAKRDQGKRIVKVGIGAYWTGLRK